MRQIAGGDLSLYGKLLGNPAASAGGKARAASLSPSKRSSIARKAANARWEKDIQDRAGKQEIDLASDSPISKYNFSKDPLKHHIKFGG